MWRPKLGFELLASRFLSYLSLDKFCYPHSCQIQAINMEVLYVGVHLKVITFALNFSNAPFQCLLLTSEHDLSLSSLELSHLCLLTP